MLVPCAVEYLGSTFCTILRVDQPLRILGRLEGAADRTERVEEF
jgi:hypothetical protein